MKETVKRTSRMKITNQQKKDIIRIWHQTGSTKRAAVSAGVNLRSTNNIVSKYCSRGKLIVGKRGGRRPKKLTDEMKQYIIRSYEAHRSSIPNLSVIRGQLKEKFGIEVSTTTIFNFVRYQPLIPREYLEYRADVSKPKIISDRQAYCAAVCISSETSNSRMIWIDEVTMMIGLKNARKKPIEDPGIGSKVWSVGYVNSVTLFSAMSDEKVEYSVIHRGIVSIRDFVGFLEEVTAQLKESIKCGWNITLILKNTAFFRNREIYEFLRERGGSNITCLYLPDYSPFLNPNLYLTSPLITYIRIAFRGWLNGEITGSALEKQNRVLDHLEKVLREKWADIRCQLCSVIHSRVFTHFGRCLAGERIEYDETTFQTGHFPIDVSEDAQPYGHLFTSSNAEPSGRVLTDKNLHFVCDKII